MLTKGLDKETERFLAEILAQEKTTSDELIKNLIRDRWMSLNQSAELAEKSGSASREASQPVSESQNSHFEQSSTVSTNSTVSANSAKQKNNKQAIAEFIKKKRFC